MVSTNTATFNEAELSDVVAVVGGVDDVGVFQLARFHQHVVQLRETDILVHASPRRLSEQTS